jgi:predicted anti-sigma-YlaC factor YlaD
VTDELEGAVSESTRRRFEEHMSSCEGCRTFARQIEQTVAVLRTLPREDAPALDDHLLQAFGRRGRSDGE